MPKKPHRNPNPSAGDTSPVLFALGAIFLSLVVLLGYGRAMDVRAGRLHGVVLEGTQWYDSGAPMLWLQAQVDHALRRDDLAEPFARWLRQRLEDQR